jgi:hypothetical protein
MPHVRLLIILICPTIVLLGVNQKNDIQGPDSKLRSNVKYLGKFEI